jgi:hypothetical protein
MNQEPTYHQSSTPSLVIRHPAWTPVCDRLQLSLISVPPAIPPGAAPRRVPLPAILRLEPRLCLPCELDACQVLPAFS